MKMKNLVFSCILTLISINGCEKAKTDPVNNQDNPLYNSTWTTLYCGLGIENKVSTVETHYNFFDGDSVFNGNTYKKLYCYKNEQHSTRFYEGLVREDNSKVFIIPKDSSTKYLLYDFSVTEGTTFEYTY